MRTVRATTALLVGVIALAASSAAAVAEERRHAFALYGIGAFLDGDVTVGERESEVGIDVDEVLDSLETAAFARYRYQADRWAFVFDGQFAALGDTVDLGPIRTDFDLDLYIFQADGSYRFNPTTEALFGVRYVRIETDVDLRLPGPGSIHRDNDVSLWDPVIGLRTLRPLGEKLRLQAQGDVGGGANMDFTWQGMVHLGWQITEGTSLWLGYRAIGMEFDDGGGRNRLDADLTMHGPEAGVVFQF